jgi:hypothetical protein
MTGANPPRRGSARERGGLTGDDMPRKKVVKTVPQNDSPEDGLTFYKNALDQVMKERSKLQGELLETSKRLRDTERELRAMRKALIVLSENMTEQNVWTANIVYEPRIAKNE